MTVFVCASIGGIAASGIGKKIGSEFYNISGRDADYGVQSDNNRIYHSPEQFLQSIQPLGGIQ